MTAREGWCQYCGRGMHDRCTGACSCPGAHPASDGIARPWRCDRCGRRLNPRGLNGHMRAHFDRGHRNVPVTNTVDGRQWVYWPREGGIVEEPTIEDNDADTERRIAEHDAALDAQGVGQ